MITKWKYYVWLVFFSSIMGCKERFEPNLPAVKQGYLVVEGFINAKGATQIKLSRSTPVTEKQKFVPEKKARVWIEGDDNSSSSAFSETGNGTYNSGTVTINPSRKYRLRIRTNSGGEYQSEFVSVKITPPIDSISWKQEDGGVRIYANTHDPQNNTHYYKWDYDETWEIHSAFFANTMYDNRAIRYVLATDPQVYYCWRYDTSSTIFIGSSVKLQKDIISLNPLLFIDRMAERIGVRYSIKVRQNALDKEGFEFFEQMKKNTESLGSIFDPQPSALKGNIQCTSDPSEVAVGYIYASTVDERRIFISSSDLTGRGFNMLEQCHSEEIRKDSIFFYVPPSWPYDEVLDRPGPPVPWGYRISTTVCVDCRLRGGINVMPAFW